MNDRWLAIACVVLERPVRQMVVLRNGRFPCQGRACHTVSDARELIDPDNEDYGLYVR
jgi:hypothetical protein